MEIYQIAWEPAVVLNNQIIVVSVEDKECQKLTVIVMEINWIVLEFVVVQIIMMNAVSAVVQEN